jgi:protein phosphatase
MTLTLRYAARSDRGLIRGGNQDSVYAGPRLLAVADGMGGMAAGDVASNIVIATMAPLDEDVPGSAMLDALRGAVDMANQQIRDAVDVNPSMEGMGTTLTALLFSGSKIGLVHVGDSRAYLLRDGEFAQITKDDTYVQMLVDEGRITAEEANSHPQRSLLTRALDGRDADPEYSVRQAKTGDRYLLCSDGLSGVVSAETIESTLREYVDPNQCAERLIQLALRGGGPDNITVVVADVTDEDIVEETPIVGGAAARDRGNSTSADQSMSSARGAALSSGPPNHRDTADTQEISPVGSREDEEAERPRRRPVLMVTVLVVLLGVVGGSLYGTWKYTQSQYYVGATDDGTVAIFKGVPGHVAWLDLSTIHQRSDAHLQDFREAAQGNIKEGIPATSESDAQRKLDELVKPGNPNLRAACPTPSPGASGSVTPGGVDPSTSAQTTTPSTAGPTPVVPGTTPGPTDSGIGATSGTALPGASNTATSGTSGLPAPDSSATVTPSPSPSPC